MSGKGHKQWYTWQTDSVKSARSFFIPRLRKVRTVVLRCVQGDCATPNRAPRAHSANGPGRGRESGAFTSVKDPLHTVLAHATLVMSRPCTAITITTTTTRKTRNPNQWVLADAVTPALRSGVPAQQILSLGKKEGGACHDRYPTDGRERYHARRSPGISTKEAWNWFNQDPALTHRTANENTQYRA